MNAVQTLRNLTTMPLFRILNEKGYTPVPIVPHNKKFRTYDGVEKQGGKAPGRYDPSSDTWYGLSGWQRFLETPPTAHVLSRWESWAGGGQPGAGILTGNVVGVDIDVTHPGLAHSLLQAANTTLGCTDFIRFGRMPKAMLVYRIDGKPIPKMRSSIFDLGEHKQQCVEILGTGQQFVAYGIHPGTGQPYEWLKKSLIDSHVNELPVVTAQQLSEFLARVDLITADVFDGECITAAAERDNALNPRDLADEKGLVPQAAAALKNEALHYDDWVRVGMALKASLPNDEHLAYELFDEFSAKSDKYDADLTRSKWETFHANRVGAGTIYHLAAESGWQQPYTSAEEEFPTVEITSARENVKKQTRQTLYYKKPNQISPNLDHIALIEELLDIGAMSVMYGESNVGKTFVAMDLAFHVATGKPYDNRRVEQGAVIYVAAEGGKSAENRIEALKKTHGSSEFPLYLVPCPVDLLRPDADTKPLIELAKAAATAEGVTIKLIVIDTLSRAIAGGNENDSQDMGAFVRNLDSLRNAINAHLLIVHHTGKDKAKGARGHSLLRAAIDTELEVADKMITSQKQRDMEMGKPIGFELKVVELGMNAYGKQITSCVIEHVDAAARAEFDSGLVLDPRDAAVLNAFHDGLAAAGKTLNGSRVLEQGAWGDACRGFDLNRVPGAPAWPDERTNFNRAFKRTRDRLMSLGYVTEVSPKHFAIAQGVGEGEKDD